MSVFEWGNRLNTLLNAEVDAQTAGEEIERQKNKHGGQISARQLWKSQVSNRSKLHRCFEWKDDVAADMEGVLLNSACAKKKSAKVTE